MVMILFYLKARMGVLQKSLAFYQTHMRSSLKMAQIMVLRAKPLRLYIEQRGGR